MTVLLVPVIIAGGGYVACVLIYAWTMRPK